MAPQSRYGKNKKRTPQEQPPLNKSKQPFPNASSTSIQNTRLSSTLCSGNKHSNLIYGTKLCFYKKYLVIPASAIFFQMQPYERIMSCVYYERAKKQPGGKEMMIQ